MAKYVGVDWASKGWLTSVASDDGSWSAEMHPAMSSVWYHHKEAEQILVDIPIGLPKDYRRDCDEQARDEIGKRRSSVFFTPCREAVETASYEEAKDINVKQTGDSISSQSWGIIPRIREVDEFLQDHSEAQGVVRESHPEVCFNAFDQDGQITEPKSTEEGREQRLSVLETVEAGLRKEYRNIIKTHIDTPPAFARRISTNARDDIVDAMVLALTAKHSEGAYSTIPENPKTDSKEHPMEIVYSAL